jgi:hypothetical protein
VTPTVYLTNWASHKTPGCNGPGRKLSIMAFTPDWAPSIGRAPDLAPLGADLLDVKAGRISGDEYEHRFRAGIDPLALIPIQLTAYTPDGIGLVRDGDTLCCACSRAEAAAGRCHRAWAAEYLARAGWRVILDGTELSAR